MIHTEAERKESQRLRTKKHREKMRQRSADEVVAAEIRRHEEFSQWRKASCLVSPGEIAPEKNAESVFDAVISAREFLLALGQPDVQPGENLLSAERRVVSAWCSAGAPLLSRTTLRFAEETRSDDGYRLDFEKSWVPIEGSDEIIDIALPVIVVPAVPDVPAVYTPVAPAIVDDPALRNYRTPEIDALCKAQQDRCDAEARKIATNNLERELLREKRLGVGYAYDAE
jgi:hypothetical protein